MIIESNSKKHISKKDFFVQHLKKLILAQLIIFSISSVGSEISYQSTEDSLKTVANEYLQSNNHSEYYNALVAIMRHFEYQGNWVKHDSVVKAMIDFGNRHQLTDFLTEAYNNRALANSYQGNNSEAILWFNKSLEIFRFQNLGVNLLFKSKVTASL